MTKKTEGVKEPELPLNENQKRFSREFVLSWNRVKSYMKAYPDCEYKSASASATRLLDDVRILTYIEEIKLNIEDLTGVSKIRNINRLAKIAYSSIEYIHNDWIELTDWELIKSDNPDALPAVESIDTKTETKVYNRGGDDETDVEVKYVKVKLFSPITAIQEINKMMGYNSPEKHDHNVESQIIILPSNGRN